MKKKIGKHMGVAVEALVLLACTMAAGAQLVLHVSNQAGPGKRCI